MSNKSVTPAVHIPRKHQSAPKTHWADTEILKAALEIDEGRYVPEHDPNGESALDGLGLSLSAGTARGVGTGERRTLEEMQFTREMNELGRHPRVVEAMAKMQQEIDDHPDSQESIEMSCMLWEVNEAASQKNKWAGQERWQGEENEEMRRGRVLTPKEFYKELCDVIGIGRVILSEELHRSSPDAKSGRIGLYVKNPEWRGGSGLLAMAHVKAAELKENAEHEIVKARRLRKAHHDAEADKKFLLAGDMIQAATEIHMERQQQEAAAPKEFLRVAILQWPLGTEWMMMNFNEYGVPTTAKFLGWRTALLTMVRNRAITEEEAQKAFPVDSGHASDWYLKQLYTRRNKAKMVN
jgi:hypothetical protein